MPPRFTYWTIIFGGQPTAFRSGSRDELLPTFKQIQSKHPDAQLRYFARGKLWYSEEEAQAALVRERFEKKGHQGRRRPEGERRGRDWRPGGQHKDPRDRFKVPRDVKRARFKQNQRFRGPRPDGQAPGGWKPRPDNREPRREWRPRPDDRKPGAAGRKPGAGGWKPRRPRPPFKKKDEE